MTESRRRGSPEHGRSRSVTSDLAQRIARAQRDHQPGADASGGQRGGNLTGWGRGARLGTEFIAAVLVGAGLGYGFDLFFGTSPWLMLVMLLMGFGAGVLNVVRAASDMNAKSPAPLDADLGPGEDDEDEQ